MLPHYSKKEFIIGESLRILQSLVLITIVIFVNPINTSIVMLFIYLLGLYIGIKFNYWIYRLSLDFLPIIMVLISIYLLISGGI